MVQQLARASAWLSVVVMVLSIGAAAQAQWVSPERQKYESDLWAMTKVELPEGLKFYDLAPVSQRIVGIVNYSPVDRFGIFLGSWRGFDGLSENVNAQFPWTSPSGLHNSPKDQWRKVAGAFFPGKIRVGVDIITVQNGIRRPGGGFYTQPQPQVRWGFPNGTIFAEMLVRVDLAAGIEWPFEIRQYEIRDGKLTDGTTYRPELPKGDAREVSVPPGKLSDFGFGAVKLNVAKAASNKLVGFKATRETITADDDHSFVPRGFVGNVRSCRDCHAQAGKPTGYGLTTIRGSGESLSWHPFKMDTVNTDADPVLDNRWPLEIKSARLKAR